MFHFDSARKCLGKMAEIAKLGESASDPEVVAFSLLELSEVLFKRIGEDTRALATMKIDHFTGLEELYYELLWVSGTGEELVEQLERNRSAGKPASEFNGWDLAMDMRKSRRERFRRPATTDYRRIKPVRIDKTRRGTEIV